MAQVVITGAGFAGLSSALFLARRGHDVELFERDAEQAPVDPRARVATWRRSGVPQFRMPHSYLGLSTQIMEAEAPDYLAALRADGALFKPAPDPDLPSLYAARRPVAEGCLRRIVEGEARINLHTGVEISGLVARHSRAAPHVVGVRSATGEEIPADFVVDASGRWTKARDWLNEIEARPFVEQFQETPFFYISRWYKLKEGQQFPGTKRIQINLNYATVMCFQADDDMFCMLILPSLEDPLRLKLREPEIFDRFINHVPALEGWLERADPVTDPTILTRINNCDRRLVDADGPTVTGFVLLGDAANHTNPTTGRGISLAYAHAQHFAETVEQAGRDYVQFAHDFDAWTTDNLGVWFRSQVQLDGDLMAGMRASFRNEAVPPPSEITRLSDALETLSRCDPIASVAFWRLHNVLASPKQVFSDAKIKARLQGLFDKEARQAPLELGPTRQEFEVLTAG